MDTLIKLMMEKTDLTEEQAKKAIAVMVAFLKEKLPEGVSEEVEILMTGTEEDAGIAKDIGVFKIP